MVPGTTMLTRMPDGPSHLERLAGRLSEPEVGGLVVALGEFADLLESHIRKEERELFPLYEKEAGAELAAEVARAVKSGIGDAMQPRNANLLK